jgi:hypothetical protein
MSSYRTSDRVQAEIGMGIYYTGDMANADAFGTVTGIEDTRWGQVIEVTYEDGRVDSLQAHLIGNVYNGTCNPRFVTRAAYDAFWAERRAEYAAEYAKYN